MICAQLTCPTFGTVVQRATSALHGSGARFPTSTVEMTENIAHPVTRRATLVGHASAKTGAPSRKDDILVAFESDVYLLVSKGKVQWGQRIAELGRKKKRARDEGGAPSFEGHFAAPAATWTTT